MVMSKASWKRFGETSDRFIRLNDEALESRRADIRALEVERQKIDDEIRCIKAEAIWEAMEKLKSGQ